MITIKQGESYPIYFTLKVDDMILIPDMIQEIKICIGDFHKTYSSGGVRFDEQTQEWWIWPSQEETLAMSADRVNVCAHVKCQNGAVYIEGLGRLEVCDPGCCKEAI